MNDYRHVCFKDLDNYFKKSDLFGGLTKPEQKAIAINLNIPTMDDLHAVVGGVIESNYDELKEIADNNKLGEACRYILKDFQTIYESNTGEIWGLDKNVSKTYWLVLTPISKSKFDKRVSVIDPISGEALDWVVYYDFEQETLTDKDGNSVNTKGKITYLKDSKNNSAYYDFKNIKFNLTLKAQDTNLLIDKSLDLYTFSKISINGTTVRVLENSDDNCNNQFDQNCYGNVFLGTTENNHFYGNCVNNIFLKDCTYNKFEWNTSGNIFKEAITYTQGTVQNAVFESINYQSSVSRQLIMMQGTNTTEPMFIVTYFDGETLTPQVFSLVKRS